MFRKALIVILLYVLAEAGVLVYVGRTIGPLNTVLLLLAGAFFGIWTVGKQGLSVLKSIRDDLYQRKLPGESLLEGACLIFGGFLLVVPGFISDVAGLLFLIPSFRRSMRRRVERWLHDRINRGDFLLFSFRKWR